MTILITGGYGFIGAALVRALVTSGQKVRVLDDCFRGKSERLKDVEHQSISGNVCDPVVVQEASWDCDEIIHLAFINGTENFYKMPGAVLDVGVRGIINVLDACQANKIPNLLLASSSEVYQSAAQVPTPETVPLVIPDPYNARYSYAAGKIISEMMVIHNLDIFEKAIIVRPHNIYGPDMGEEHVIPQMARRIQTDGELTFQGQEPVETMNEQKNGHRVFYGVQQTRSFCYISDAVSALMLAREKGIHGQIYNIGNEDEIPILGLARKIAGIAGKTIKVTSLDGAPNPAPGGTNRRCPDISKIAELGYTQTVTLDAGLHHTLKWYWR